MNTSFLLVSHNPWLYCAIVLTFRIVVVGMAWSWVLPGLGSTKTKYFAWIVKAAQNILIGLIFSLLLTLLLAELGAYTPAIEWIASIVFALAGFIVGYCRKKDFMRSHLLSSIPGIILFAMAIGIIMNLPNCGEWIVGGWDPGVYQNQGINVAKTGTFYPPANDCYKELTPAEFQAFTVRKAGGEYNECFTGIPVDQETRSFDHYFFRLTPSFVAPAARAGGLRAATRINYIAGMLVVVMFIALMIANKCRISHIIFSAILLLTQPIWLYHLHVPTTEMLQLLLLCSLGFLLPARNSKLISTFMLPVLLFLAIINRMSFLPFATIFIFIVAYLDIDREDRTSIRWERGSQLTAVLMGALFNTFFCTITMVRLTHVSGKLAAVAIMFALFAILVDIFGSKTKSMQLVQKSASYTLYAIISGTLLLLGLIYFSTDSVFIMRCWQMAARFLNGLDATIQEASMTLHHLFTYAGFGIVITSILGCIVLFINKNSCSSPFKSIVFFNLSVFSIMVMNSYVANLYPWATRRFSAYLIPLLTLCAGYLLSLIFNLRCRYKPLPKIFAGLLLILIVGSNIERSRNALISTEYNGASEILAEMAHQIEEDDILLVDHTLWGTPLTFIYGKQVLNGQYFFERSDKRGIKSMRIGLEALKRMHEDGKTIRFLTSTKTAALDVYPLEIDDAILDWSGEFSFKKVDHSKRATRYVREDKTRKFRLFTWHPK